MSERFFIVRPVDSAAARAVRAAADEDGFGVEVRAAYGYLVIVPGQSTGWDDQGTEKRYRRLAAGEEV